MTIEALFQYLDLNEDDTEFEVNKKLTSTLNRRVTVSAAADKTKGSPGNPAVAVEEPVLAEAANNDNDDDIGREWRIPNPIG